MKLVIITDAWRPQVSGVVRTFTTTVEELKKKGHEVLVITPNDFNLKIPCPTYPDIKLVLWTGDILAKKIEKFKPEAIHIATEGPLGFAGRDYCMKKNYPFSTSFATRFPDYIKARFGIPEELTFSFLRWFHSGATKLMVSTKNLKQELEEKGFNNVVLWGRGVDTELFRIRDKNFIKDKRPVFMYIGRVAVEKNMRAFLDLPLEGSKYVVGDGPELEELKNDYKDVRFVGMKFGEELAKYYAAADVFVMPSKTETFGLVILEALSSGVPVAAFPVRGPIDVIGDADVGVLNDDLFYAANEALKIDPQKCREFAMKFSWENLATLFIKNLAMI